MEIYILRRGKFEKYSKDFQKDAEKFLYWKIEDREIILVASSFTIHQRLAEYGLREGLIPEDPRFEGFNISIAPNGAGAMEDGDIVDWSSLGYKLQTPTAIQKIIREALIGG